MEYFQGQTSVRIKHLFVPHKIKLKKLWNEICNLTSWHKIEYSQGHKWGWVQMDSVGMCDFQGNNKQIVHIGQ